jgi:N-acetylneuraminic acid mutarotase
MKKLFLVMFVLVLFMGCKKSSTAVYVGNWTAASSFEGISRGNATSFVIGDKVYLGMGFNNQQTNTALNPYLSDFWMWDTAKDFWTKLSSFPGSPRIGAVSFVINGKGYMGCGYNGSTKLKDFWEFNPADNSWTQKADFAHDGISTDDKSRYGAIAFTLGNYGYVGTGKGNDDNNMRDFYKYDPSNDSWTQIASMGGDGRMGAVSFTYDGKAYVTTGVNNGISLLDMWMFDPASSTWTQKAKLNVNTAWTITRSNASAFVLGSKAYICGGYNSGVRVDCWEYNFADDSWTKKTDFEGSARQDAVSIVVNEKAYIATGRNGNSFFNDIWEFRPFDSVVVGD